MNNDLKDWFIDLCQDYVLTHKIFDHVISIKMSHEGFIVQGYRKNLISTTTIENNIVLRIGEN